VKKDCFRFKEWTKKKGGIEQTLVCFESNLFDVPSNIWWIDSGSSVQISNSVHGSLHQRVARTEGQLFLRNVQQARIEAVGSYRLILASNYVLELEDVFCVPSVRRNLISVSRLDSIGFCFSFKNSGFILMNNSNVSSGSPLIVFTNCILTPHLHLPFSNF